MSYLLLYNKSPQNWLKNYSKWVLIMVSGGWAYLTFSLWVSCIFCSQKVFGARFSWSLIASFPSHYSTNCGSNKGTKYIVALDKRAGRLGNVVIFRKCNLLEGMPFKFRVNACLRLQNIWKLEFDLTGWNFTYIYMPLLI